MRASLFCTAVSSLALLITVFDQTAADVWPGRDTYDAICLEIINDAAANAIPFRRLVRTCSGWWWWETCRNRPEVHETVSRFTLCDRLVQQHNSYNQALLGVAALTVFECHNALSSPAHYGIVEWNNWSGRHCGTWTSTAGSGGTFNDEAYWSTAVPAANIGFYRQDVTFDRPGICCDDAWNESGGDVSQQSMNKFRSLNSLFFFRKWWYGDGILRRPLIILDTRAVMWVTPLFLVVEQTA